MVVARKWSHNHTELQQFLVQENASKSPCALTTIRQRSAFLATWLQFARARSLLNRPNPEFFQPRSHKRRDEIKRTLIRAKKPIEPLARISFANVDLQ